MLTSPKEATYANLLLAIGLSDCENDSTMSLAESSRETLR